MQNYGNYETQQLKMNYLNLDQKNVKKNQNQNEKLKKAVTYTIGTLAGVALATLVGYGMVHKGSVKKVVDGAKKNAQKVADTSKTIKNHPEMDKMFKCLDKINNKQSLTPKEIQVEINILEACKNKSLIPQVNQNISIYIGLLQQVLKENPNLETIGKDKYENIFTDEKKRSIKVEDILTLTEKEKELKEKLAQQQLNFEDLNLNDKNQIIKNGNSIDITESFDDLGRLSNSVQLRHNIYYNSDDNAIYIFKDEKYHKVNISKLVNLNPIKENNGHKFLDPSQVNSIDKAAIVENVTIDGNNIQCIKGVKKVDTDTDLYIKVQDLTEKAIATIVNTDASQLDNRDNILNAIKENCDAAIIGKVLANNDLKDKLVDASGNPTDAGTTLITGWVTSHKDQAADIASALKEINEFGDKSVGAAFVNDIKENCKPETIKSILTNLFGTNKDIEIASDSKEQLLLDVLFFKINLSEFKTFIKGTKIKTYTLQDEIYKNSILVQDSVFKLRTKTYTKAYFLSKTGTYDDTKSSFEKYLLQQCEIDTTSENAKEYTEIANSIDTTSDDEPEEIKLSFNDYSVNELLVDNTSLTNTAKRIILNHNTGDNNLDSLEYTNVKQEDTNSTWLFGTKKGNSSDPVITISGIKFKYYVQQDDKGTNILYIRKAKNQS